MNETAAGALVGERGGDGQAGQQEQGEDGDFGLHGELVSQAISPGNGESLAVFGIFLKKKARAEARGARSEGVQRSSCFDEAQAAADLKESW